jgi:hypothetical protein
MKFHFWGMNVVPWIFVAFSVSSALYLTFSTLNYLNFYPALGSLEVSTLKLSLQRSTNAYALVAEVSISNPSSTSGFIIQNLDLRVYFINSTSPYPASDSLFVPAQLSGHQDFTVSPSPHSTYFANVTLPLNPSNANALLNFTRTYQNQALGHVTLDTQIITFLDPVTGRLPLESVDTLPLT